MFTCTKLASSESKANQKRIKSESKAIALCVLHRVILARMTRCNAKRADACAHATKTQCPASACARLATRWHYTHRTPKQHMLHIGGKTHAIESRATPCTHELDSAGLAWLREKEKENMQNERRTRPLPHVAFSAVTVMYA